MMNGGILVVYMFQVCGERKRERERGGREEQSKALCIFYTASSMRYMIFFNQ